MSLLPVRLRMGLPPHNLLRVTTFDFPCPDLLPPSGDNGTFYAGLTGLERAYRLVEVRRQLGLSQADLARTMGVDKLLVTQIEQGMVSEIAILASYVQALDGRLKVIADFGDTILVLNTPQTRPAPQITS